MKIKNKKNKTIKEQLRYSVHLFKPAHEIHNFNFSLLNDFLKKAKKNSVSELFIYDLLDYCSDTEIVELITKLLMKLQSGGKLYIQGTDVKLLSSAYLYGQIDLAVYKAMVFGNKNLYKNNILNISTLKNLLTEINDLTVSEIKFINGIQYYIECTKNE